MTIRLQTISVGTIFLGLLSCSNYPETPQKVVEEFSVYISSGECEKAMELCIGNAREVVQGSIDSGCDTYETTVDSVTCEINGEEAICNCHETRKSFGSISFPYELEKTEGKWKISGNGKDGDKEEVIEE